MKIVSELRLPLGSVVHSMLTLAQFQAISGSGWVLADGQSAVGTAYGNLTGATAVPDMRGMVLRGKNNGRVDGNQNPDGDVALGLYQADNFASHTHTAQTGFTGGIGPTVNNQLTITGVGNVSNVGGSIGAMGMSSSGGNETRMKNVTVNIFIRVN